MSQSIKAERNGGVSKFFWLGRDDKNIDSTENVKKGSKNIKCEKLGKGRFFSNFSYEGGQKFTFYLRGSNTFFNSPKSFSYDL